MNGLGEFDPQASAGYVENHKGVTVPAITNKTEPIKINVAGKNFGTFDKLFLEKLPRWQQLIRIKQRIIDPSILYVDWNKDKELPGLQTCLSKAQIDHTVSHEALDDAIMVIKLLRKKYNKK